MHRQNWKSKLHVPTNLQNNTNKCNMMICNNPSAFPISTQSVICYECTSCYSTHLHNKCWLVSHCLILTIKSDLFQRRLKWTLCSTKTKKWIEYKAGSFYHGFLKGNNEASLATSWWIRGRNWKQREAIIWKREVVNLRTNGQTEVSQRISITTREHNAGIFNTQDWVLRQINLFLLEKRGCCSEWNWGDCQV